MQPLRPQVETATQMKTPALTQTMTLVLYSTTALDVVAGV